MADAIATGTQNVKSAYDAGQNGVNSFDPQGFGSTWSSGSKDLFGGQQGQQTDYIKAYKDTIANNPTATDLYSKGNEMFNVPALQQNANTLNNAVLQAPQQTLDSARGFNYDANQVANQTNLTLGRLSPLAAAAQNNANTAQNNASNYVQAGLQQNATNLMPVQAQGQMMNDLWARQATNFTTENQATLDALAQKMQSGVQLSSSEMAQLASLAQAEESYNAAIRSAEIGAANNLQNTQLQNQFKVVPAGNTLVNTFTGKSATAR